MLLEIFKLIFTFNIQYSIFNVGNKDFKLVVHFII